MAKEEQEVHVKITTLLNCSVYEIKAGLDKVYGNTSLSYPTVARWSARFTDSRETVKDDPRPDVLKPHIVKMTSYPFSGQ